MLVGQTEGLHHIEDMETCDLISLYSEGMLDPGGGSESEISGCSSFVPEYLKTFGRLYEEKQQLEKRLSIVLQNDVDHNNEIEKLTGIIKTLQSNNEFLCTENTKLKNSLKLLRQSSPKTSESGTELESSLDLDVDTHSKFNILNKDINEMQNEFKLFRDFVCQEISLLKKNVKSTAPLKSETSKNEGHTHTSHEQSSESIVSNDTREHSEVHVSVKTSSRKENDYEQLNIFPLNSKNNGNLTSRNPKKAAFDQRNPFSPIRFVNNGNHAPPPPEDHNVNENIKVIPVKPGKNSYSEAVTKGTSTLIFGTSMIRSIDYQEFNQHYEKGTAKFQKFNGHKMKHIKKYVTTHLDEERPDCVILQGGGNDLSSDYRNADSLTKIANDIIDAAHECRRYHVKEIWISSVLPRSSAVYQGRRSQLNKILKDLCYLYDFKFIENENIVIRNHILKDGVHLNNEGTIQLARNFLRCLNS